MENLTNRQKLTVMVALMAAMFFAAINQTLLSNAMPRIIAILDGMNHYSWVLTSYLLTSTIATVLVGKLSDIYGRRGFLLIGISIFMAGSFLSGLSHDVYQMIIYRAIQGIGGGVLMSATITAVGDLFAPRERAKWTGLMMAIFGFSSVIGPTLGGFLIEQIHWSWLFWISIPFGILAFVLIWRLYPRVTATANEPIDYAGMLVLSLAIVALLLGFSWGGSTYPWLSSPIIGLFVAALLLSVLLVWIERRAENPVLPMSLFGNSVVTLSNAIGFLMNAGMVGTLTYLPFFVQGVHGLSPTQSGLVNIPMSLMLMAGSSLVGRWMSKTGRYKLPAIIGVSIMTFGMLMMVFMNSIVMAVVSITIFGIGLGFSMPVFTLAAQNAVSPSQIGVVTAASTLFRNLGGVIGVAVLGSMMNSSLQKKLSAVAAGGNLPVDIDPAVASQLQQLYNPQILLNQPALAQLQESMPQEGQTLLAHLLDMLRTAMDQSITSVFIVGTVILAVALVLVFLLKEIALRGDKTGGDDFGKGDDNAQQATEMAKHGHKGNGSTSARNKQSGRATRGVLE